LERYFLIPIVAQITANEHKRTEKSKTQVDLAKYVLSPVVFSEFKQP
jgi:hypothetical protein